jgi:hypothetical protein
MSVTHMSRIMCYIVLLSSLPVTKSLQATVYKGCRGNDPVTHARYLFTFES